LINDIETPLVFVSKKLCSYLTIKLSPTKGFSNTWQSVGVWGSCNTVFCGVVETAVCTSPYMNRLFGYLNDLPHSLFGHYCYTSSSRSFTNIFS